MQIKKIIYAVVLMLYFLYPNTPLFAPGFSLNSSNIGPFTTNDNISITLGNDFSSGEVISSSEINLKFNEILYSFHHPTPLEHPSLWVRQHNNPQHL